VPGTRRSALSISGLRGWRRSGAVTELLFLYECATREVPQLRIVAARLGLTVQAASHIYRQLARRGLVELREGRYRPTVAGLAWLHGALGGLRKELDERLGHLQIIRSCRAVALTDLAPGTVVSLELRDGLLVASPRRSGGSHGRVVRRAGAGDLVRVEELKGILPIARGRVEILSFPPEALADRRLPARLREEVRRRSPGLLAAQGLEAFHVLRAAVDRPIARYGVAAAVEEASRLGVDSVVVALTEELPRLLDRFAGPDPPPFSISALERTSRLRTARRRR
jgi:predicted transcriptional regulator